MDLWQSLLITILVVGVLIILSIATPRLILLFVQIFFCCFKAAVVSKSHLQLFFSHTPK